MARRRAALIVAVVALCTTGLPFGPRHAVACSCGGLGSLEQLKEYDAAFVGTLLRARPHPHPTHYTFRVEDDVLGNLPAKVDVWNGERPGGGSSSCGFSPSVPVTAVALTRRSGEWYANLCDGFSPDATVGGPPPPLRLTKPTSDDPPAFLAVRRNAVTSTTIALDARGRPVAYATGPGVSMGASVCPGGKVFIEAIGARDMGGAYLHLVPEPYGARRYRVRRVSDLKLLWETNVARVSRPIGYDAPNTFACRDPEGSAVWVAYEQLSAEKRLQEKTMGRVMRLTKKKETTVFSGEIAATAFSPDRIFLAMGPHPRYHGGPRQIVELVGPKTRPIATTFESIDRLTFDPTSQALFGTTRHSGWDQRLIRIGFTKPKVMIRPMGERTAPEFLGDGRVALVSRGHRSTEVAILGPHLETVASWTGWGLASQWRDGVLYGVDWRGDLVAADAETGERTIIDNFDQPMSHLIAALPGASSASADRSSPAVASLVGAAIAAFVVLAAMRIRTRRRTALNS